MHLNAKVFCLLMFFTCVGVSLYCGFKISVPPEPLKDGTGKTPELIEPPEITLMDFVSNQLVSTSLIVPVDPFRPTIEAIFTNAAERAAFIAALKKAKEEATGVGGGKDGKKADPFAHLRKKEKVPGQEVGPSGRPMITPNLTYTGYFKRPDGTEVAVFHDSVDKTSQFYDQGNKVRGVDIIGADLKNASLRMDDGSTREIKIGDSVQLAPIEAPPPPPPEKPAAKVPGKKMTPAQREAFIAKRKAEAAAIIKKKNANAKPANNKKR